MHDLTFLHYPQFLTDESRRYYNDQIDYAVHHADHILTDSEASKRDMITMLGVPADKITVHLLGVDESFQAAAAGNRRALSAARSNCRTTIFCSSARSSRARISKGWSNAYRALLSTMPDAPPLVLAGRMGWNFDAMRDRNRSAQSRRSSCSGAKRSRRTPCPRSTTARSRWSRRRFTKASAFRRSKRWRAGTVPIVSNRSSLPEVVGEVGLQVDPDDQAAITAAMRKVLTDETWRHRNSSRRG